MAPTRRSAAPATAPRRRAPIGTITHDIHLLVTAGGPAPAATGTQAPAGAPAWALSAPSRNLLFWTAFVLAVLFIIVAIGSYFRSTTEGQNVASPPPTLGSVTPKAAPQAVAPAANPRVQLAATYQPPKLARNGCTPGFHPPEPPAQPPANAVDAPHGHKQITLDCVAD